MKLLVSAVALLLPQLVHATDAIQSLSIDTFDNAIKGSDPVLVKFYAEWCGHCKTLAPVYEEAAKNIAERKIGTLAKVECPNNQVLCTKYGIKGYPTMKLFQNGAEVKKYTGARTTEALRKFMEDAVGVQEVDVNTMPELDGEVFVLNGDNFASTLASHDVALVKFYSPWCGHCKNMADDYREAAGTLSSLNSMGILAEIDCTANQATCQKYEVQGYPTLKVFKRGVPAENYKGPRQASDFVRFVEATLSRGSGEYIAPKEEKKPVMTTIEIPPEPTAPSDGDVLVLTRETFNAEIMTNKIVLVMFYAPWCGHCNAMKPAFKEAAATLATQTSKARLAMIDCTDGANQPICEKHEIKGYPTLKLFKAGKFVENYQQHRTAVAMLAYINSQIEEKAPRPITKDGEVHVLERGNFDKLVQEHDAVLVKFFSPDCEHCRDMADDFRQAATQLKAQGSPARLAEVDCAAAVNADLCTKYAINAYPTVKLFRKNEEPVLYGGARAADSFVSFAHNAVSGGKPAMDGHVMMLGDASFDAAVRDNRVVLVKFYATWCGHCKTLAPVYKGAAEELAKNMSPAKLAEVDCTVYGDLCKRYDIDAYPIMKLFMNGNVVDGYMGDRTVEALVAYMDSAVAYKHEEL